MYKFTKIILLLLIFSFQAQAQHWSYVYIQGDKETPFYVKLEDEMLPRYSKNYYIIPQLEEGPIHIQILFQQNIYPPQNFTIEVPKNGNRSFLLTRKDNTFSLYDIQQKNYLSPGEQVAEKLPETKKTEAKVVADNKIESANQTTKVDTNASDPNFINNIELNNNHTVAAEHDSANHQTNQEKPAAPSPETFNIAQEKAVNEMPAAEVPQPTVKQQVESDFNKIKEVPATTEETATDSATEVTTPTTLEPENEVAQTSTTTNTEKDINKVNPDTVSETTQENKIVETPTTTEQTVEEPMNQTNQQPVNTTVQPEQKVEKDFSKVNVDAAEEKPQTNLTTTPNDQQQIQETVTPPTTQTEQTKPVPSAEVIKAEQEYYNAQKAKNEQPAENNNQSTDNIIPATTAKENTAVVETPTVTAPQTVIEHNESLPPAPPHPTSYYKEQEEIALSSNNKPIINSACPEPINDKEFDKIYNTDKNKADEKDRLKFLMKEAEEDCFSTRQVYFLAKEITAESMRYNFLKKVYAHVTDQQNFKLLEDNLFKTLEWKSYFRTIQ